MISFVKSIVHLQDNVKLRDNIKMYLKHFPNIFNALKYIELNIKRTYTLDYLYDTRICLILLKFYYVIEIIK